MSSLRCRVPQAIGLLVLALLPFTGGCKPSGEPAAKAPNRIVATLETDKGAIEIELLPAVAPKTVENFRLLAQRGYYRGCTFFRVVKGFMVQTGDPTGTGKGGESAWGGKFDDEIDKSSPLYRSGYLRGSVAMANAGPNTNTSQFFIVQSDYPLYAGYTIFGKVIKGMDAVDAMMDVPMVQGIDGNKTKPATPITLKEVTIRELPPAPAH